MNKPILLVLSILTGCGLVADRPLLTILEGRIDGALYKVVRPEEANGKLLLLAHGFRPESLPLNADFGQDDPLIADLLAAGWTIASTSYRRNGWIVEDGIQDLLNLREYVSGRFAEPESTYLLGGSMGGLIITMMAERHADVIDGGLAMGAALMTPEGGWRGELEFNPRVPLLFLTNQSELTAPRRYCAKTAEASVVPTVWEVARDGHVNLSQAEQGAALKALVEWVESGNVSRDADGTILANPPSTAVYGDGYAEAPIRHIHRIYGNITVDFVREDMGRLGIDNGTVFHVVSGEVTVSVLMGTTYSDVPTGGWVAFWNADGYLFIAQNFGNASSVLGTALGDVIRIMSQ